MPQASSRPVEVAGHLRRLVHFTEPRPDDTCLDVTRGKSALAPAIGPRVREFTSAGLGWLPSGPFTLVTAWLSLAQSADPVRPLHEMLAVCQGRLIIADLVRTRVGNGDRIERLRDPEFTTTRTPFELIELLGKAGGVMRRLEAFTIERPVEPWLDHASEPERIRRELAAELDGGPKTGARPRLVGGELWFAQSWAYIAAEPVGRRGPADRVDRRRPAEPVSGRRPGGAPPRH